MFRNINGPEVLILLVLLPLFVVWIIGVVRLFTGRHTLLGILSFVPWIGVVAYAGFFVLLKPGSSRYPGLNDANRAKADLRYPAEAAAHVQSRGRAVESAPASWYDDPDQPGAERYWDGSSWTDRRRPKAHNPPQPPPPQ